MVAVKGKTGKYLRTKEHCENISKANKGRVLSKETKDKLSLSLSRPIYFDCDYCGKRTRTIKSAFNKKKRHFCSSFCYGRFKSEKLPCNEQGRWRGGLRKVKCSYCGKGIRRQPYVVEKNIHFFCNRECASNYRSENYKGKIHYNWKGGSSWLRIKYGLKRWKRLRKEILERDNYLCIRCGNNLKEKSHKLIVHHIMPVRIKEDDSQKNLITLCSHCHSKLHWEITRFEKILNNLNNPRILKKLEELK